MIIKSFTAESSSKALKKVREEMGGDAIVLKTRNVIGDFGKSAIEVTACLESGTVAQTSGLLKEEKIDIKKIVEEISKEENLVTNTPADNAVSVTPRSNEVANTSVDNAVSVTPRSNEVANTSVDNAVSVTQRSNEVAIDNSKIEEKLDSIISMLNREKVNNLLGDSLDSITATLKDSDFPEEFIESFVSRFVQIHSDADELEKSTSEQAQTLLVEMFSEIMEPSFKIGKSSKVMFIGPPASGKSSVMSKIAADLIANKGEEVKLLSLDDVKIGAHDELYNCADFLGLETIEREELSKENQEGDNSITLIDTPSLLKTDASIEKLQDLVSKIKPDYLIAVFSATMRTADIVSMKEAFSKINPTHTVVTMNDMTTTKGAFVAACNTTESKLALYSNRPGGSGLLETPDPNLLAGEIFNPGDNNE